MTENKAMDKLKERLERKERHRWEAAEVEYERSRQSQIETDDFLLRGGMLVLAFIVILGLSWLSAVFFL